MILKHGILTLIQRAITLSLHIKDYQIEDLVDDLRLYKVDGNRNPGIKAWEFSPSIVGGVGQGGYPPLPEEVPDWRLIEGTLSASWTSQEDIKIEAKGFRMNIGDTFDFLPGETGLAWWELMDALSQNTLKTITGLPLSTYFKLLRLLEVNNLAYDIDLNIDFRDNESRSKIINVQQPQHDESENICEPLNPPKENQEVLKVNSFDPNDILGPEGFGDENWIPGDEPLDYTIRFENIDTATAPARQVRIVQQLDSDLDFRSFRLGSFGFSGFVFEVPENQPYFQTRLDLLETYGVYVDVFVGIDVNTREIFWELTAIDPETGEIPTNPLTGFLPPNLDGIEGQGFVTYTIDAIEDVPTGTVIDAAATIFFDNNEPIDTPPIFNTIDNSDPVSTIQPLPAVSNTPEFLVQWTGSEEEGGSAIQNYTVYVSKDGESFTPWLENTTLTEATYLGEDGSTYEFFVAATDNAGNQEFLPEVAQASVLVNSTFEPPIEPDPLVFDPDDYIASHPDLIQALGYDLAAAEQHYQQFGQAEGRALDLFPEKQYLASYSDLITAFSDNSNAATRHYIENGFFEGRKINLFKPDIYLNAYPDLVAAFGNDLDAATRHYIEFGYREQRDPLGSFDGGEYIASYDDLITAFGYNPPTGRQHYLYYGYDEGRSITFEADEYIASYGDLIEAFGYDLAAGSQHYIIFGSAEGRQKDLFDAEAYLNKYGDLKAAFGNDLDAATKHFIEFGYTAIVNSKFAPLAG